SQYRSTFMAGKKRANGESSIYQRPDGRWCAQVQVGWFNGKRQRKYIYGKTRKDVAQQLVRVQRDLQQGLAPVSERVTVAEWVPHWLAVAVKPPARRLNTYVGYEVRVRRDILPYLGHHRLARLQPHDVEKWLQALREREYTPRNRGTAPEDRRYEPRT